MNWLILNQPRARVLGGGGRNHKYFLWYPGKRKKWVASEKLKMGKSLRVSISTSLPRESPHADHRLMEKQQQRRSARKTLHYDGVIRSDPWFLVCQIPWPRKNIPVDSNFLNFILSAGAKEYLQCRAVKAEALLGHFARVNHHESQWSCSVNQQWIVQCT